MRHLIKENLYRIESNTQLAQNVYCRSARWHCRGLKWRMAHVLNDDKEVRSLDNGLKEAKSLLESTFLRAKSLLESSKVHYLKPGAVRESRRAVAGVLFVLLAHDAAGAQAISTQRSSRCSTFKLRIWINMA